MLDVSTEQKSGRHSRTIWLSTAIGASIVGGVSVIAFAGWWLTRISGDCGVIRIYEQVFAVMLIGVWLAGTAVGVGLAVYGFVKKSRSIVPGSAIAVLVNSGLLLVCAKVVHSVREADFSLKSTETLMQFLQGDNKDNQILAAYELGEHRAAEAVPMLCALLEDDEENVNLRLNACRALGQICAPPPPSQAAVDQAVASLTKALRDKERFIPQTAAESLGKIGNVRAIDPLTELLVDETKDDYTRVSALKAIGDIGGEKATEALKQARTTCKNKKLIKVISDVLDTMNIR
ncbi:MAG: HEAT repeat domain-containing protein [Sedimentisphaerales bacterium]|nr:HEAT repeat domain-containing protein [Sedimentisphaerales bacterium]